RQIVESHAHFVGRARLFEFECHDDILVVRGCVPTYYLKQVLQTALKDLAGVRRIDNRVEVYANDVDFERQVPQPSR
ncbi:MAG TPA: hypothetical protein VHE81_09260, partial [Lacipirellulaceae bacterium]|nr:hypothetical protein [Lacipirellulaceae bacterium]